MTSGAMGAPVPHQGGVDGNTRFFCAELDTKG